jgi:hypothetical protein
MIIISPDFQKIYLIPQLNFIAGFHYHIIYSIAKHNPSVFRTANDMI